MSFVAVLAASLALQAPGKTVEVPFVTGDNAIIVEATINGRKASLMFDTGFSGSVIVDSSLNIGKATGQMNLRDFVGQFSADTVKVTSLKLGNQVIDPTGMEAVKRPGDYYSLSYNTHCTGIMGFEVIKNYITEINFQQGKFIFHPNTLDISKRVPDNKRTFLGKLLPKGNNSMEMLVEAENGKKMTLALDTGNAFFATTHKDVLERIGMWDEKRQPQFLKSASVASGEVTSWYARFKNAKIYGIPVPESTWSIIDLPSSSAEGDGTIGYQFLKNFNIIIDYGRRRVWFENFTGEFGNQPKGDLGISAGPNPGNDNRVTVFRVSPGSPADKAGIKVGDVILSMDGVEMLNVGWRRLYDMFEGEQGSKVKLTTSRRGELIRYELERALLVNELTPVVRP